MAECNYDEVTHSIYPPENPDPMYHWEAHFPERLSRLHLGLEFSSPVFRRNRRAKERSTGRYKTQPITFDEITEVDEDTSAGTLPSTVGSDQDGGFRGDSKASFRNQVGGFSRSVDGLVATSGYVRAKSGSSTGSDKENTPCDPERVVAMATMNDENRTNDASYFVDTVGGACAVVGPDVVRHRRKRSARKLRHRNAVPEEIAETEKMEESSSVEG